MSALATVALSMFFGVIIYAYAFESGWTKGRTPMEKTKEAVKDDFDKRFEDNVKITKN